MESIVSTNKQQARRVILSLINSCNIVTAQSIKANLPQINEQIIYSAINELMNEKKIFRVNRAVYISQSEFKKVGESPRVQAGYKLYMVSNNVHSQVLLRELAGQPEEGYTLTRAKEEQIKKLDSLGATSIDIAIAKVENICKQTTKTEVVREII